MRNLVKTALCVMALIAASMVGRAQTQVGNYGIKYQSNNPEGQACGNNTPLTVVQPVGTMYTCQNGTMQPASSGGGGGGMVYPAIGVANSTGAAWGTSYAVSGTGATLALTASPALTGTPTAPTATAGTNTTQLATTAFVTGVTNGLAAWPPPSATCVSNPAPPNCMDYIPIANVTGTGWTGTLDANGHIANPGTNSNAAFSGPIFIYTWPAQGNQNLLMGNVNAGGSSTGYRYIQNSGIPYLDVARVSAYNVFANMPSGRVAIAYPYAAIPGSSNDLNTLTICGDYYVGTGGAPASYPANMPPNVVTNNPTGGIAVTVACTTGPPGGPANTAQTVFDQSANIMWYRTGDGTTWNAWTQAAGGGGGGMVYPPVGIGVSTGTAWGTSINPATLATWPPVLCASAAPTTCPQYVPVFNNTLGGTAPIGWNTNTTSSFQVDWSQTNANNVDFVSVQGASSSGYGIPLVYVNDSRVAVNNVALLSKGGSNVFSAGNVEVPTILPYLGLPALATNDLNTWAYCGFFSFYNNNGATPPGWPANMPPNVAANNPAVQVPLLEPCAGSNVGAITTNTGHAQIVFDAQANIMWFRTVYSGNWNSWQQAASLGTNGTLVAPNLQATQSITATQNAVWQQNVAWNTTNALSVGLLACVNGLTNAGTAINCGANSIYWSGIVAATSGTGANGTATLITEGYANCIFDGTATAGDWAVISTSTNGECHDSGNVGPSGPVVGLVIGAAYQAPGTPAPPAGSYQVYLTKGGYQQGGGFTNAFIQNGLYVGTPSSAYGLNTLTFIPGTTVPGRRGVTWSPDPAGDFTLWFSSYETPAGVFVKDGGAPSYYQNVAAFTQSGALLANHGSTTAATAVGGLLATTAGMYGMWNIAGTSEGESDFINQRGNGPGGWLWYNASNTGVIGSPVASLNASGTFQTASLYANVFSNIQTVGFAVEAGAGAGATATCQTGGAGYTCTPNSGFITLTTGTAPAIGDVVTASWANPLLHLPVCVMQSFTNPNTAAANVFIEDGGVAATNSFKVYAAVVPAASTTYSIYYVCM